MSLALSSQTVRAALKRHGLRRLAARTLSDLRRGGAGLVWSKFRIQRALLASADGGHRQSDTLACGQAAAGLTAVRHDGPFALSDRYTLPRVEFERFMRGWRSHPAIAPLVRSAPRQLHVTIVVCRHSIHGFEELSSTLASARGLVPDAGLAVRVVVFAPAAEAAAVAARVHRGEQYETLCISGLSQLREVIASEPDGLVHFVLSGDEFDPHYAVVLASPELSQSDLVLTDMYFLDGDDAGLVLLPGINLIHALNVDYFLSRAIVRGRAAARILEHGGVLDVQQLVVAALCSLEAREPAAARHIAFPLLRIAETRTALDERRLRVLANTKPARLTVDTAAWVDKTVRASRRVSVIICTKNNGFLLEQLVTRLWRDHADLLADVVVVANRVTNDYARMIHRRLAHAGKIEVVAYDAAFNFSTLCNLGAASGKGDVLLFLNDDIAPINHEWLRELVAPLEEPGIGIVGPLLLYPDQSVQHAGMYLGFGGVAGHTLRGAHLPAGDYGFLASAPRQVMAVTGAALCMRREDFAALNGFDQNLFALYIQDVDLCLRAHFSGLAVVFNPRSVLLHMESVSVKPTLADPQLVRRRALELEAFARRWGQVLQADPFHNPNFARSAENLRTLVAGTPS